MLLRERLLKESVMKEVDLISYTISDMLFKNSTITSRPPVEGFVLQDTNGTSISQSEVSTFFGTGDLSNTNDHRNLDSFIAVWSNSTKRATFSTELPHNLEVDKVK